MPIEILNELSNIMEDEGHTREGAIDPPFKLPGGVRPPSGVVVSDDYSGFPTRHGTEACGWLLFDQYDLIDVLVKERGNMPPLHTSVSWYEVYEQHMSDNPGSQPEESLPWTTFFSQETLRDVCLGIQAVDAMETGLDFFRPVDPSTASREIVQETFEGVRLRRQRLTEKVREMKDWIKDEERIGEI
ncbi:hypothetical protein FGRMN_8496 [Fusarium graminum]|nr:hypothetical protein FGRMN_8496 [Fusarium graminum]